MNDAKQNYAAVAESEFDLRREVVRLRDINKDLLEALRECMGDSYILIEERKFAKGRYEMEKAAIRKAEGK